jgi:hypothetical protein
MGWPGWGVTGGFTRFGMHSFCNILCQHPL